MKERPRADKPLKREIARKKWLARKSISAAHPKPTCTLALYKNVFKIAECVYKEERSKNKIKRYELGTERTEPETPLPVGQHSSQDVPTCSTPELPEVVGKVENKMWEYRSTSLAKGTKVGGGVQRLSDKLVLSYV